MSWDYRTVAQQMGHVHRRASTPMPTDLPLGTQHNPVAASTFIRTHRELYISLAVGTSSEVCADLRGLCHVIGT